MRKFLSKTYLKNINYYPSLNMFWQSLLTEQGFPIVSATNYIPECLITYNSVCNYSYNTYSELYPNEKHTVNFFTDDNKFNAVWTHPQTLFVKLSKYHSLLSPDFTLSFEFPDVMNRWNHYRKMWVTAWWQSQGLIVIPVANWLDESSYEWCFEGMPMNSTIAVSTNEISTNDEFDYFKKGLLETINRLSPNHIICYGTQWMKKIESEDFETPITFYRHRKFNQG